MPLKQWCVVAIFLITTSKCMDLKMKLCSEKTERPKVCQMSEDYIDNDPPRPWPATVNTIVDIVDVTEIDEADQTLTIFADIIISWTDPGVSFTADNITEEGEWYQLKGEERDLVWRPSISFLSVFDIQKLPEYAGTTTTSYWLQAPHYLEYAETVKVTISCELDFSNFPFDEHACDMDIGDPVYETYSLIMANLEVYYNRSGTSNGEPSFTIVRPRLPFTLEVFAKESFDFKATAIDEIYSYAGFTLVLRRTNLGQLLAGYYGPTGIFALLSSLSYMIPPEQVPGRMGMLVTLYLITANLYSSVKAPPNRGFSYIEKWMCAVQVSILMAIMEYGYVLSKLKFISSSDKKRPTQVSSSHWKGSVISTNTDLATVALAATQRKKEKLDETFKKVDRLFALLSFTYFILFNAIYWLYGLI